MKLSTRSKPYIIPEYSLTGDLLSFLTCNLQYRYQNRGTLPPSMPIQLWFGEFIHGIMEEAFLKWENEKLKFPWDWENDIRPLEEMMDLRLKSRNLFAPPEQYCPKPIPENIKGKYKRNSLKFPIYKHPYRKIASARIDNAINTWGPHLFPLIKSAEVLIKGIRDMPHYDENKSRSNYYGINGVIDVLSSVKIEKLENQTNLDSFNENKIIKYLKENEEFKKQIKDLNENEYEIIIDYKGMKRPPIHSNNWIHHKWQILTYSWLRSKQAESKPITAGIILYLNELVPSTEDILAMKNDIEKNRNDVKLLSSDEELILNWDESKTFPKLSDKFKLDRSIRIIPINDEEVNKTLNKFDEIVYDIESSLIKESEGCKIKESWTANGDMRTCNACDFKSFCNKHLNDNSFNIP